MPKVLLDAKMGSFDTQPQDSLSLTLLVFGIIIRCYFSQLGLM